MKGFGRRFRANEGENVLQRLRRVEEAMTYTQEQAERMINELEKRLAAMSGGKQEG